MSFFSKTTGNPDHFRLYSSVQNFKIIESTHQLKGNIMSADFLKDTIQIEWKETAPCAKEASVKVSAADVEKTFQSTIKEVSRDVQIQGFRKGKVPVSVVKARFGEQILEDVAKEIQNAAINKMQDENELVAVTALDDNKTKPAIGSDYNFKVTIEVAPTFTLPDYKAMKVEVAKAEPADKLLAERLASMKETYAENVEVDGEAAVGDMLKVSYESDFTPAEDAAYALKRMAKADDSWVWISEPEYVPGINAVLTGAKVGDVKEFASVFPADWREAGLAGKTVNYKVKVNKIERKEPIKDDAELAKKLQLENADKMYELLKKNIEQKAENDRKNAAGEKVMEQLIAAVGAFALPKSIVDGETEREFSKLANQMVRSEEDVEKFKAEKEKHLATAKENAEKNLRRFFLVRKIAELEKIEVSKAEFDAQIKQMCAYFGYKEKDLLKTIQQNGAIGEIHADILTGKVLEFIVKSAAVTEI